MIVSGIISSTLLFSVFAMAALPEDCVTLHNSTQIRGSATVSVNRRGNKGSIAIGDTSVDIGDVKAFNIQGRQYHRVRRSKLQFENFAVRTNDGPKVDLYATSRTIQASTIYSASYHKTTMRYFSTSADTLYYFNLSNLRRELSAYEQARPYLTSAYHLQWLATGIRLVSIIPFFVATRRYSESTGFWLGAGALCLVVPSITITPVVKKRIRVAIDKCNEQD